MGTFLTLSDCARTVCLNIVSWEAQGGKIHFDGKLVGVDAGNQPDDVIILEYILMCVCVRVCVCVSVCVRE